MLLKGKWAMLPHQFRRLIESLRTLTDVLREAKDTAKNQKSAIHDASETASEAIRKVPRVISEAIRFAHEDVPAFEKTQRHKEYTQQRKILIATWATFGATFLAFGAAAYYAWIAKGQLKEMIATGKQTDQLLCLYGKQTEALSRQVQANEMEERAFVTFAGAALGVSFSKKGYVNAPSSPWEAQEFYLKFANVGNTTARSVKIRTNWQTFEKELPKDFSFPLSPKDSETVLDAKVIYQDSIKIPQPDLLRAYRHASTHIYAWGTVTYRDIFPDHPMHVTEFCARITRFTPINLINPTIPITSLDDTGARISVFETILCAHHNCSDEDCDDYKSLVNK